MERLKSIKEQLVKCVESQLERGLECVDTEELGEAVDMIKDLEEAMYYCSVVHAMEDSKQEQEIMSRINQKAYFPRDSKEGKSPISRKHYMETKELHRDATMELEQYVQELQDDLMDMIRDATPEEKNMLSQKLSTLSSKIKQ